MNRFRNKLLLWACCCVPLTASATELENQGTQKTVTTRPDVMMASGSSVARQGPPIGWSKELGGAVIVNPEFQGSGTYGVLPVPYFDFRYRDSKGVKHFINVPQGLGTYFYRARGADGRRTAASIALAPGFASRDADEIDGLDTFGPGVEVRLGLETGTERFGLNATLAQAVGTGHKGLYLDVAASWRRRVGQQGFFAIGPTVRFGDDNYMSALYGVTSREQIRSGVDSFDTGAGLESMGIQSLLSVPLKGKWRLTTVARIGTLLGDAKDSSLTEESLQAFMVTAVTRRF